MKKVLSVFELLTRNTIYQILLVLVAMGAMEIYRFSVKMQELLNLGMQADYRAGYSLEQIVELSDIDGWFGLAFVFVTVILCLNTCNLGSVQSYTIKRLQLTETQIFWIQSVYNAMCFILLWGVQLFLLLGMSYLFLVQEVETTNQTVFLAFYRNDFMHSILPMEEGMRWLANICMILSISVATAAVPFLQRRGKFAIEAVIVAGILIVGFSKELGDVTVYIMMFIAMNIALIAGSRVYKTKTEEWKGNSYEKNK